MTTKTQIFFICLVTLEARFCFVSTLSSFRFHEKSSGVKWSLIKHMLYAEVWPKGASHLFPFAAPECFWAAASFSFTIRALKPWWCMFNIKWGLSRLICLCTLGRGAASVPDKPPVLNMQLCEWDQIKSVLLSLLWLFSIEFPYNIKGSTLSRALSVVKKLFHKPPMNYHKIKV